MATTMVIGGVLVLIGFYLGFRFGHTLSGKAFEDLKNQLLKQQEAEREE